MKKYSLTKIKKTLKEKDAFSTVFFVDPIAIRLLYIIANYTKITPNQITIFSFISGIIGFIIGVNGFFLISLMFFYFAFLFDCIDGKLSRLKKQSSNFGYLFDGLIDSIIVLLFNILIIILLLKYSLYYYVISVFTFNYIRFYKDIVGNYFKKFIDNIGILNINKKINLNRRFFVLPNDVDIMYFFFIIGNLILFGLMDYGYNTLLFVKINIILTTLFYILLFIIPLYINLKKIGKIEKK